MTSGSNKDIGMGNARIFLTRNLAPIALNNEHGTFKRFGEMRGNLRIALDERNLIAFSEQRARKVFTNHSSTNDHAIH